MTISYPLSLPTVTGRRTITFRQVNAVALTQSPFTFKQQAIQHTGQRWEADVTLPPMSVGEAKVWIGWLSSLKGQFGTFTMGDPVGGTLSGVGGGTPLVNGADQTGDELVIDGAPASTTGWLSAGDYIQLGSGDTSRLHMVLVDVDTDAGGNATLDLWPSVRIAPIDNAAVTISNTVGLWRLNSNSMMWDINVASQYGMSFTAVEAYQ